MDKVDASHMLNSINDTITVKIQEVAYYYIDESGFMGVNMDRVARMESLFWVMERGIMKKCYESGIGTAPVIQQPQEDIAQAWYDTYRI